MVTLCARIMPCAIIVLFAWALSSIGTQPGLIPSARVVPVPWSRACPGNRPTDWAVLDLDADPTPGDPFSVRQLARRFLEFAADVEYARGQVASLGTGGVVESWLGDAGDAFREEIAEFPGQLQKLETSYRMVGDALTAYEPILAAAQVQADRALAQGRDARFRRASMQNLLGPAQAVLTADVAVLADLASASSTYTTDVPPPPDPAQMAQAIRNRDAAQARLDQARNAVRDGQDELDAARRLALSAKAMREDAAKVCVRTIRDASDAGIRNKPWYSWEKVKETAGKVWTAAVQVAKITVAVLGVVALIIGGPAAWVVFAAAVVVLADTLVKYGRGQASPWDVAFALLGSVPGTKGLTTVGGLARGIRGGSRAVAGIRGVADAGKLLLGGARTLVHGGQEMAVGAVAAGRRRHPPLFAVRWLILLGYYALPGPILRPPGLPSAPPPSVFPKAPHCTPRAGWPGKREAMRKQRQLHQPGRYLPERSPPDIP
ncbi:hypothetical protein FDG2_1777 [Candidatus Protofrankia californiensis]|uniref:Putative T7SS secretion signal domain-containing protein n=1 Tax=Candidatus Protofrankia californiensis TaxID=1839754 RepID=A0A1C3NWD5_9ACTN|nr:hypothetical protein FDG2_1777 [Candidatus Protofrankia californiensis]